jgi:signal transduction histidine kinase
MEFFAHHDEVARLQASLPQLDAARRCRAQLALAWYGRQESGGQAMALCQQLAETIPRWLEPQAQAAALLRLELIRLELSCLQGPAGALDAPLQQLLLGAKASGDLILQADVYWLLAFHSGEIGHEAARHAYRQAGMAAAEQAGDRVRTGAAQIALIFFDVISRKPGLSLQNWQEMARSGLHPVLSVQLHCLLGVMPNLRNQAVANFMAAFEAAQQSGQLRAAIVAASNVGDHLNELNEHEAALEWNGRALELARPTGWGGTLALALLQTGETLRRLGRFEGAQDLLQEAMSLLQAAPLSRNFGISLLYLGQLALDSGDSAGALGYFTRLQQLSEHLQHLDFQVFALCGLAAARLRLGEGQPALALAHQGWRAAQESGDAKREFDVLKVLAQIHGAHDLPDPLAHGEHGEQGEQGEHGEHGEHGAALYYWQLALATGSRVDGHIIDAPLFDALAAEYARLGQHQQAYGMACQGSAAREKTHTAQATSRAIALQIRYQTERVRAEGEREQQLAQEKARHLALLQQTRQTLEHLDAIGRQITTQLDPDAVFQVLEQHVQQLLPVDSFAVYLEQKTVQQKAVQQEAALVRVFALEHGQALPLRRLALDDHSQISVRCLHQRQPLYLEWPDGAPVSEPGTVVPRAALYSPLLVGERALGVMSIQSQQAAAFGEREQLIFHTLCSYAAIALDNAYTWRQLFDTQSALAEQEKLAALGGLVAGVAHELNTPLGNGLMMSSSLAQSGFRLQNRLGEGSLTRREWQAWLEDSAQEIALLQSGLHVASDLVASFGRVVIDQGRVQRQQFDLASLCQALAEQMQPALQLAGLQLTQDIPPNCLLDGYPGPLQQVLAQLLENAMAHAYAPGQAGHLRLAARSHGAGQVRLVLEDDGCGIAHEQQKQVFEPFFTSKMGQGHCGLGLSMAHNIIHTLWHGQITVKSQIGHGSSFTLDLPLFVDAAATHRLSEPNAGGG